MSKGKILFIDDDSFLRKVYQSELNQRGYEVYLAVDGEEGLKRIAEVNPDLIILDLIMPKKSGFEVLADLRRFAETRTLPVIVLSNLAQPDDQKRAFDLGANDYLVKDNTTIDVIAAKIEQHLQKSAQQKPVNGDLPTLAAELERRRTAHEESPAAPTAGAPAASAPHEPSRGHHFCPHCGYRVDANDRFCPDCGEAL